MVFNAIRMAWNNFSQRATYNQEGSYSTSTVQRNADVVWLEAWFPTAFLYSEAQLQMTFLHAEVLDIRARARQLQKLLNWEDEGAVVDRWVETCAMFKAPSRLALSRYLNGTGNGGLSGRGSSGRVSLPLLTSGSNLGRSCTKGIECDATRDLYATPWTLFPSGIISIGSSLASLRIWKRPWHFPR